MNKSATDLRRFRPGDNRAQSGRRFEQTTKTLLRLIPNSSVEEERLLLGKKVDLLCNLTLPFNIRLRLAVECKFYSRKLHRGEVATIVADYAPLVISGSVDGILLVTWQGLSPAALELIDRKSLHHHSIEDLALMVMGLGNLVSNMEEQFHTDNLSRYFVQPDAERMDRRVASLYQGSEHPASRSLPSSPSWPQGDDRLIDIPAGKPVPLWPMVRRWILDENAGFSLAILGGYGRGKSSFARFVAFTQAKLHQENPAERVPLLIHLRDFSSRLNIEALISSDLATRHNVTNPSFERFSVLNRLGRFLIILDGFDEMRSRSTPEELGLCFAELAKLYTQESKVLLLGRPSLFANLAERDAFLRGAKEGGVRAPDLPSHALIELAALRKEATLKLIRYHVQTIFHATKSGRHRIAELIQLLSSHNPSVQTEANNTNDDLREAFWDLLSRPFHIPMLVVVLQTWTKPLVQLSRSALYSEFIDISIQRELTRTFSSKPLIRSATERRDFAERLAMAIAENSTSGVIRIRDIPDEIFHPFMDDPREPLSAVRRDLLGACFVETQGGDHLSFGHKSYCEYLAACRLSGLLQKPSAASIPKASVFSEEMVSFARELLRDEDIVNTDAAPEGGIKRRDLLPELGRCFAKNSLAMYWKGQAIGGRSILAPHVGVAYSWLGSSDDWLGYLIQGIAKASSQFCEQCVIILDSLKFTTESRVRLAAALLSTPDQPYVSACVQLLTNREDISRRVEIVRQMIRLLKREIRNPEPSRLVYLLSWFNARGDYIEAELEKQGVDRLELNRLWHLGDIPGVKGYIEEFTAKHAQRITD